jgi:hypothetical protein
MFVREVVFLININKMEKKMRLNSISEIGQNEINQINGGFFEGIGGFLDEVGRHIRNYEIGVISFVIGAGVTTCVLYKKKMLQK